MNGTPSRAGGFLLAGSILAGVVIGSVFGQPSAGFLGGVAVGLLAMTAIWLHDRRR